MSCVLSKVLVSPPFFFGGGGGKGGQSQRGASVEQQSETLPTRHCQTRGVDMCVVKSTGITFRQCYVVLVC